MPKVSLRAQSEGKDLRPDEDEIGAKASQGQEVKTKSWRSGLGQVLRTVTEVYIFLSGCGFIVSG